MIDLSGQDIRAIRLRHRYTQGQFAHMVGVNSQTLSNWERGIRRAKPPRVVQVLAHIIDSSPVIREEVEKIVGLK